MRVAYRDVAEAFVEARRQGRAIADYPGEKPQDLVAAYSIQDHALSIWKRTIGGWKVGKINPPDDGRLGANRLIGPVFADEIFEAAFLPVNMPVIRDGFAAAEAEFMLRLSPPAGAGLPGNAEEAKAWVDEIRIGIEIASSPYPGINRDGPCVTISDHGNNAGLILGQSVERHRWDSLDQIEVTLQVDGRTAGTATTATMLDGPFGAVSFLLGNLHQRGIAPEAGWWVSSGAITGVHEVAINSEVEAKFSGIGKVAARIL